MALQQVNNDSKILKDIELVPRWNDTKGDRVRATLVITEMLCDGVAAFIGPEGSCFVESIVSQSWNVPMISYVSTAPDHRVVLPPYLVLCFSLTLLLLQCIIIIIIIIIIITITLLLYVGKILPNSSLTVIIRFSS